MTKKENFELDLICEAVIRDHLLFVCCPNTFKTFCGTKDNFLKDFDDLIMRKNIMDLVSKKMSLSAVELVDDKDLKKILLKQAFVELVSKNELEKALNLAEDYLKKYEDDEVFSILGYKNLNDNEIKHYFNQKTVDSIKDMINETLFCKINGRNTSLMTITWFHYKSIQSFLNK